MAPAYVPGATAEAAAQARCHYTTGIMASRACGVCALVAACQATLIDLSCVLGDGVGNYTSGINSSTAEPTDPMARCSRDAQHRSQSSDVCECDLTCHPILRGCRRRGGRCRRRIGFLRPHMAYRGVELAAQRLLEDTEQVAGGIANRAGAAPAFPLIDD